MPHELPVFFLPTAARELGVDPEQAAEALIAEAVSVVPGELVEDTSTYWWRAELVTECARAWGIVGLEFLGGVAELLTPSRAEEAAAGAQRVLERLAASGVPAVGRAFGPELEAIRAADVPRLVQEVAPLTSGSPQDPDAPSFVAFLKAVIQAASESSRTGRHLLYYRPQP